MAFKLDIGLPQFNAKPITSTEAWRALKRRQEWIEKKLKEFKYEEITNRGKTSFLLEEGDALDVAILLVMGLVRHRRRVNLEQPEYQI